jgi:uncharacterized membrane protein
MRILLACLFLLCTSVTPAMAAVDSEVITAFTSIITTQADTSIAIKETIEYETPTQKHGIYRTIPYRYERGALIYRAKIKNITITDNNQASIPYTSSNDGGNLVLKIGDKDKTFTGKKTYLISYTVENAVQKTDEGARLYWDITGEGWQIPINYSTAKVITSVGEVVSARCYSGEFGSDDKQCLVLENGLTDYDFVYPNQISYGDNMTVDLMLEPSTAFSFPTPEQILLKQILDNLWLILLPLPFFGLLYVWYRYGRDYMFVRYNLFDHSDREKVIKPVFTRFPAPMVYEPLDITPGQAGAMLDESYDIQDLVADILDLARKKYIKIDQTREKSLFRKAEYTFTKLKEAGKDLQEHQKLILSGLFVSKDTVELSKLKGKFYTSIPKIKEAVFASLFEHTMFTRNPHEFQKKIGGVAIALFVALIVAAHFAQFLSPLFSGLTPRQIGIAIAIIIPEAIIGFLLIQNLTQKTAKGFNYMQQARGLKETIARGKWREEIKEKHLFIEEVLPFAVALGVVGRLTKDMKDLNINPPSYFHGSSINSFTTASFLSSFSSDVGSSISHNPNSSSWSGGSGGGSSGGGGGGGGGGSW